MRHLCFVLTLSACAVLAQNAPADTRDLLHRGQEAFEQVKPADTSPENAAFAETARTAFEEVLQTEPNNKIALQYLASLALRVASGTSDPELKLHRAEEARAWFEKLAAVDPREKEAWYSLGVIDWYKWHPQWMEAMDRAGMSVDALHPLPDEKVRQDLQSTYGHFVEDGISNLQRALDIDPQYADALNFMSTFVHERAFVADTAGQFQKDIALANDWERKVTEAKKAAGTLATAAPRPVPQRIRVGGNVQAKNLIRKVIPMYPQRAREAGIQGTVRFQVIIGKSGLIQNVQLVSGDSELVEAAREAVQQWVYKPTLLNDQPVEVVTMIDVNFQLHM